MAKETQNVKVYNVASDVWRAVKVESLAMSIPMGDILNEALQDWLDAKSPTARGLTVDKVERPLTKREQMLPKIIEMRAKGMTYIAIGQALGVYPQQISNWIAQHNRDEDTVTVHLDNTERGLLLDIVARWRLSTIEDWLKAMAKREQQQRAGHTPNA